MMTRHEKRDKFQQIRQLIAEIDTDESRRDDSDKAKQHATDIARLRLNDAHDFLLKAERMIMIRDGVITP